MEVVEPIQRLRIEAANRAKIERAELYQAFKDAVAPDVLRTTEQRQELEDCIGRHSEWLERNGARLEALLPRTLKAIATYEMKRDAFRNQISSILTDTMGVSVNILWGHRPDGQRDPAVFPAVVSGVKQRLGQARGLVGGLDRIFNQIDVELTDLEKRGHGLPHEPVPLIKRPPDPSMAAPTSISNFNPRLRN